MIMMRQQQEDDRQSRVFDELCSMINHVLRLPPLPIPIPIPLGPTSSSLSSSSPSAFASLFIGISFALMLFGSVAFVIGFILLPSVVGLVLLFYFAGIVSNLSELGRHLLFSALPRLHRARGYLDSDS